MKQTTWFALVLAGGMLLSSCGKSDENANTENTGTEQSNSTTSNNSSNVSTANTETAAAPREKAVSAQTLKDFMPSIGGFKTEGEVKTTQLNMSGQEYAFATQRFINGEKMIEITIADYNQVQGLTAAYSMMMSMSVETNDEVTKGEKFGNFPGWVTYQKDNSSAQAGVSVNDHMWVIIQADNGVTIDQVRSAMNSIDLSKLASVQ